MSEPMPLTAEDRAILELESETIAGHTCKVIVLGPGGPGVDELRVRVAERIEGVPPLTYVLDGSADAPAWVRGEEFDADAHVRPLELDGPVARERLGGQVARVFEQRLDRSRPLWRIDVAPLEGGGSALIWRIHHALADGTAAIRFARSLLWDAAPAGAGAGAAPAHHARSADDDRRRAHLGSFLEREFAESLHRSPFDGRIGTERRIAFAAIPLGPLHDAAKRLADATLNDAVLSVVAGALRGWIEHHHGSLGAVRVRVPVSLHHEGDDAGNRDSFFTLALPLNEPDPVERLRAVHAATETRKQDHDAELRDSLVDRLGRISPRLSRFCERLESSPRRFAVSVSNVPGPRKAVSILAAPVEAMHTIAEIGERHALRISVVSLDGVLYFGFCADPGVVDGIEQMAAGVEAEGAALIDARSG